MTKVNKSGTILINCTTRQVGLVYRKKHNDYSFPKGHQEEGESILECAIRETEEETQRLPEILAQLPTITYIDSAGDECKAYWYIARDLGKSHKQFDEELRHELVWIDFDKVEDTLSYDNLKELWNTAKEKILEYFDQLG